MFLLDLALALLSGVFFARRCASPWPATAFALWGMGLPGAVLCLWWPGWHTSHALALAGGVTALVFVPGVVFMAWLGHRLGTRWPRSLPLAAVSVSVVMWTTLPRMLQWTPDGPLPPLWLLALLAALSGISGAVFVRQLQRTRPAPATREVATFCRICEAHCGLVATVEKDDESEVVASIRFDRDHPVTRGYGCTKGLGLAAIHHDSDRVDTPLKRVDGVLVPISWEQALSEIGERLSLLRTTHGPRSIALYRGNPSFFSFQHVIFAEDFMRAVGSPNVFTSVSIDCNPKFHVARLMFGHPHLQPIPDLQRTSLLVCLGTNPLVSQGSIVQLSHGLRRLQEIEGRGGRVLTIDPRRTETARRVGEHWFIRPGTDAALLLALGHVVVHELGVGLESGDHIEAHDAYMEAVRGWTPERAADATGVPAVETRALAQQFATAAGAAIYLSTGITMGPFGSLCVWAAHALSILTGNFDSPGGSVVPEGSFDLVGLTPRLGASEMPPVTRQGGWPQVNGAFPTAALAGEISGEHADRVRALVVSAGNPVHSVPGSALGRALGELDLLVSIDLYLTETAARADYVLPAADPLEHSDFPVGWMALQPEPYAQFTEGVVRPKHERRPEWRIFSDLARAARLPLWPPRLSTLLPRLNAVPQALGFGGLHPDHVLALLLRSGRRVSLPTLRASPSGQVLGEVPTGRFFSERIQTPSGRVHLAPAELVADLDRLSSVLEQPRDHRLQLIGLRERNTHNSWLHNHPTMRVAAEGNTVRINPADAEACGVSDGDLVRLTSDDGEISLPAKLSDHVMRGVVAVPHGWGHRGASTTRAPKLPGANANRLIPGGHLEPLSGQAIILGHRVELTRVG